MADGAAGGHGGKGAALLLFAGALAAAGCQKPTHTGVVVGSREHWVGSAPWIAPDLRVRRPDGSRTRLDTIGGAFYVVAFVEPPGTDPCYIHPAVRRVADELYLDCIPVVQITLPTEACPLSAEARAGCPPPSENLVRLFDPDRAAWRAFGQPEAETMLLIDCSPLAPVIDTATTVHHPEPLLRRADDLQKQWEYWQREVHRDHF